MYRCEKPPLTELVHHGIKGMHWGVRRTPEQLGYKQSNNVKKARDRLTSEKQAYKNAKKEYNRKTVYGIIDPNLKEQQKLIKAANKVKWAKEDVASEKIKEKLKNEPSKSNHRLKLEEQYRSKGMTEEEAAIAAFKRVRTEKIIAVTAGVTVAAAATYVAYKHYDHVTDRIISQKTTLHNISTDSNKGVSDAFYAAFKNRDRTKYRGLYGAQLGGLSGQAVYDTSFKLNSGLKVASDKSATKVLESIITSDPQYRSNVDHVISKYSGNTVMDKGLNSLRNGKVDKHVWEAVNTALVDHSPEGQSMSKRFYDGLKSAGYDAIMDVNDRKYSGYKSSKPIIVFNGAAKATVDSVRQLSNSEISSDRVKGYADVAARALMPTVASYAGSGAAIAAGLKLHETKSNDKIVQQYRQAHPNTSLSYTEILRNEKEKRNK